MLGVGGEDFAIFGMHGARGEDAIAAGHSHSHHGRFRHGRRAVVHGRVGHIHPGELADHGLKFEDGGERALRDLGLVGRVGSRGIRSGRLQCPPALAGNAGRHRRPERTRNRCAHSSPSRAKVIHDFVLRFSRRNVERTIRAGPRGKMGKKAFERLDAERRQHLAALNIGFRQIAHERIAAGSANARSPPRRRTFHNLPRREALRFHPEPTGGF